MTLRPYSAKRRSSFEERPSASFIMNIKYEAAKYGVSYNEFNNERVSGNSHYAFAGEKIKLCPSED
jgi:hypothetical protein